MISYKRGLFNNNDHYHESTSVVQADVHLIDFGHVRSSSDEQRSMIDSNVLVGIQTLVAFFRERLNDVLNTSTT